MGVYVLSSLAYFLIGMFGAATFLFLMLLFDKEVAMLENEHLSRRYMAALYILCGGILAAIMSFPIDGKFGVGQLRVALGMGLGWPAIATGIGAGKQIGNLSRKADEIIQTTEARIENRQREVTEYYQNRLDQAVDIAKLVRDRADKDIEEIRQFYEKKISSLGGDQ